MAAAERQDDEMDSSCRYIGIVVPS